MYQVSGRSIVPCQELRHMCIVWGASHICDALVRETRDTPRDSTRCVTDLRHTCTCDSWRYTRFNQSPKNVDWTYSRDVQYIFFTNLVSWVMKIIRAKLQFNNALLQLVFDCGSWLVTSAQLCCHKEILYLFESTTWCVTSVLVDDGPGLAGPNMRPTGSYGVITLCVIVTK
jgi:hypothetical protein